MSEVCAKHVKTPAFIYGACIGCELEGLRAETQALREEVAQQKFLTRVENDALKMMTDKANELKSEVEQLEEELESLRARVVVAPDRLTNGDSISRMLREIGCDGDVSYHHAREIWNACLDGLERLNGKTVSKGLLRRISDLFPADMGDDGSGRAGWFPHVRETVAELRALLNQDKENGDHAA
ncbi:hypothetical protein B7H20_18400 [Pseudomonas aeruginosa]|uniref:hypothetical protein n=1 Tax=Pseudomonas aeruginosa TaxID=287 RepID=UPI000A118E05|nr:hypothetical protein [Pseudomonas aeruginosa]ORL56806.1 hypothetical protein B7H20_18400 [Pseudomonas aeruginosa]